MKRILALLLTACLTVGCSLADKDSIINLLSSPRLSERENAIVTAIKNYLGYDIILKYPKQGADLSPVQIVDLDDDGQDEAVALYSAPSNSSNVRIAVLSRTEEGWSVDYEGEGFGSEVYSLSFERLKKDEPCRIIVGYTFSDTSEKLLSVYFISDRKIEDVETFVCQDFLVYDVTGDSIVDIVLAGVNADNQHTRISVYSTNQSSFLTSIASMEISVPNAKVTAISPSLNDFAENKAIVLDYYDTNRLVYTQAFYYRLSDFVTILPPDVVQKVWDYPYPLCSMDVDGDGYLETPTVIDDARAQSKDLKFMEWTNFLLTNPERKYFGFCRAQSGLYFPLPDEWQGHILLSDGREENTWLVAQTSTGKILVTREVLEIGEDVQEAENTVFSNIGTVQIKLTFDESVSKDQRDYIVENVMYIK